MISRFFATGIVLVCMGCASAGVSTTTTQTAPTASTVTRTAVSTVPPAGTAFPTRLQGAQFFLDAEAYLDAYVNGEGDAAQLYGKFARGAIRLLEGKIGPGDALAGHPAVRELEQGLKGLRLPDGVTPRVIVIPLEEAGGERRDLLCFSFVGMQGMPIVMLQRNGATLSAMPMEVLGSFQAEGKRWARLEDFEALDVTGDGRNELVFRYVHAGGSNSRGELEILKWDANTNALTNIFHGFLVNWSGDATYRFIGDARGNELELTFPYFGTFSAKGLQKMATERWSYDAKEKAMVRVERQVEPPQTVREQVNLGEALFRDGEFELALEAFEIAATDAKLRDEVFDGIGRATREFARFRQGQILAVLGREQEAREHLAQAKKAGGTLEKVVEAFLRNYSGENGALRAWAMLQQEIDLDREMYESNGRSNLDLPATADEILFQGSVVSAYLNRHPGTDGTLADRVQEAGALGFPLSEARVLDWDGDGQNEVLMVAGLGAGERMRDTLWLLYQRGGNWRARKIMDEDKAREMHLPEPFALPTGRGKAMSIAWVTKSRHEERWSWDGASLRQLDLQTLEPLAIESNYYVVGWLPERIEF